MQQGYFITGTDTEVGKTWCTVSLMHYFKNQGKSVIALKPVASGCQRVDGRLLNDDALLLQRYASLPIAYADVNPYAFELPVSPHLAAKTAGKNIELEPIVEKYQQLKNQADITLVEGVGGWCVPLNEDQDLSDLAKALALPVIMVVAIRLGCINHARLTYQAIKSSQLNCAGWIASCHDPDMLLMQENVQTLQEKLEIPLLGLLPYSKTADFDLFAQQLNLPAQHGV